MNTQKIINIFNDLNLQAEIKETDLKIPIAYEKTIRNIHIKNTR